MRNKNFFDAHQAARYLNHSIIRVDDEPVTVIGINEERSEIIYVPLGESRDKSINLDSSKIDLNPVPLGFINYSVNDGTPVSYATYAMRTPQRNWNIGLTTENLSFSDVIEAGVIHGSRHYLRNIINSDSLRNTIKGVYPKLPAILREMSKKQSARSSAFSRAFAINARRELFFKWKREPIGRLNKDLTFELLPPNECLTQVLTEDIDNARA